VQPFWSSVLRKPCRNAKVKQRVLPTLTN
jgi:hypothetical protein